MLTLSKHLYTTTMKNLITVLAAFTLVSCGGKEEKQEDSYQPSQAVSEGDVAQLTPEQEKGRKLFDGKGNCFSCHRPDEKSIGPSIKDIAKIYKEKNGDMVKFLKEEAEPIVDPANYAQMKTNFFVTKKLSDEELKALEAYFYSFDK